MDINTLKNTQTGSELASDHLRALWHDLHGDWDTAHTIVQNMTDVNAMWIHAYLHRKEPDIPNAKYWYRNAGKPYPEGMDFNAEVKNILLGL
jgi:hypothetical protein